MAATMVGSASGVAAAVFRFLGYPKVATALATGAVLPVLRYGPKVYTRWLPQLVKMGIGEARRALLEAPNIMQGLDRWQDPESNNSHFFCLALAKAVEGMSLENQLHTAVVFDCAGSGEYAEVLNQAGIATVSFDFSKGSESATTKFTAIGHTQAEKYDLVFSPSDAMSKTKPGEELSFVMKLFDAAKPEGMIVVTCAVPDQPGSNSNPKTNAEVIALFTDPARKCTYDEQATMKLRNLIDLMPWVPYSLLVFRAPADIV